MTGETDRLINLAMDQYLAWKFGLEVSSHSILDGNFAMAAGSKGIGQYTAAGKETRPGQGSKPLVDWVPVAQRILLKCSPISRQCFIAYHRFRTRQLALQWLKETHSIILSKSSYYDYVHKAKLVFLEHINT